MTVASKSRKRLGRGERGMQLLELALALPFLLVLIAGVVDFAQAWNMRQILANAARDGARLGSNQPFLDLSDSNPTSIQQICQQVAGYLNSEHVNLGFMNISGTSSTAIASGCSSFATIANSSCAAGSTCVPSAWTYYSTGTYGLKIERTVSVPSSGTSCGASTGVPCIPSTRVTLNYPYNWSFGFNHVVGLFGVSNYPSTISIQVFSTMADLSV